MNGMHTAPNHRHGGVQEPCPASEASCRALSALLLHPGIAGVALWHCFGAEMHLVVSVQPWQICVALPQSESSAGPTAL